MSTRPSVVGAAKRNGETIAQLEPELVAQQSCSTRLTASQMAASISPRGLTRTDYSQSRGVPVKGYSLPNSRSYNTLVG